MKIALLGYGKMGKTIEAIALKKGHEIILKIDKDNVAELTDKNLSKADVAIEFSTPQTVYNNILQCFKNNIPIVVGTTAWQDKLEDVIHQCKTKDQTLFYASNFSIGVNIFFQINKKLAKLMESQSQYDVQMEEIHHLEKLDSPSGTGITLAEGILENISRKSNWVNDSSTKLNELSIISKREANVPGTHTIFYNSDVDSIEIKHTAHSRAGFASGAVLAAEWLIGKKGIFGMNDLLNLND